MGWLFFLRSYTFVSLSLSLLSAFPLSNLVVTTLDFGVQTTDCFVLLGRLLNFSGSQAFGFQGLLKIIKLWGPDIDLSPILPSQHVKMNVM